MTETKESVEPTWQEKLGIKNEKTQQLMEIAGQGVSIFCADLDCRPSTSSVDRSGRIGWASLPLAKNRPLKHKRLRRLARGRGVRMAKRKYNRFVLDLVNRRLF